MTTKTKLVLPLLLAAGLLFTNLSCKKSAGDDINAAIENNNGDIVTMSGRTATGSTLAVQMPRPLLQQAKAGQPIRLQKNANGTYTGVPAGTGTAGITSKPPNCPPVSPETIAYYQQEANNCCCSFVACLIGEYCDYYFYHFMPDNDCLNGGELE